MNIQDINNINLSQTADILGVSTATIRNWIKHDFLIKNKNKKQILFDKSDVFKLKLKIKNGEINRLNKRANKKDSKRSFLPVEYLSKTDNSQEIEYLINYINKNRLDKIKSLFSVAMNLIIRNNLADLTANRIILKKENFKKQNIFNELYDWHKSLDFFSDEKYFELLTFDLPEERDLLGLVYQYLLNEGKKSKFGMYYTPNGIVNKIKNDYLTKDMKVLDPCCGSGQFLLNFAEKVINPENIYGFDIDQAAVRISRINLMLKYRHVEFQPRIFNKSFLLNFENYPIFKKLRINNFDLIATNPPWGMHYTKEERDRLIDLYPEIKSFESFSYFIKKSSDILKSNGVLSFILPESILNVSIHKDIREYVLMNNKVEKITLYNRVFKNVFSKVVRLDIRKNDIADKICIENSKVEYKINQNRFKSNHDFIFDIHTTNDENKIIEKIYSIKHTNLKNQADWVLGVVTGNNNKYIINKKREGYEEIIKGRDLEKFKINIINNYIKVEKNKFQQMAPVEKYRTDEKLIYKFISKKLVFAYDNKKRLTLNSANILMPKVPGYPIKVILALFNSDLYQFIFQKNFFSLKVLKGHLETLPLPLWDKNILNKIIKFVGKIEKGIDVKEELDNYIMEKFNLHEKEKIIIKKCNS